MQVLEELYYTKEHEWVRVEGDVAYIGITDYAQSELGDVIFVELPEEDEELDVQESFGAVESVKAASDLYMPLGGTITEVNEELEDSPELVNNEPYDSWMIKIKDFDKAELDTLLSGEEYQEFCQEEE